MSQPMTVANVKYVTSLVVDPSGTNMIRVMNDGSFALAQLPTLTTEPNSYVSVKDMYTAAYSTDGKTLYVADMAGNIQSLDVTSGAVKSTWPSLLDPADALLFDGDDGILVGSGNGGLSVWSLPDGKVQGHIPGGSYYVAANFSTSTTLDVMLSGQNRLRTFALPSPAMTSDIGGPKSILISNNRIIGKSASGMKIWEPGNATQSHEVSLQGDGRAVLTPDGSYLAWAQNQFPTGSLEVFSTSTGKSVKTFKLVQPMSAFTLSDDGRTLVYSMGDQIHTAPVMGLGVGFSANVPQMPCCLMQLSATGNSLLLASQMGGVMLYDLAAKKIARNLQVPYIVAAAGFSPKMDQAVLVSDSGSVLVWNIASAEEPRLIGSVIGYPMGIAFNPSRSMFVVTTDTGEVGWFSLAAGGGELAMTTWLEATQSWLTVAADGQFTVIGDVRTPLGQNNSKDIVWEPASQQPGFNPDLLEKLLAR